MQLSGAGDPAAFEWLVKIAASIEIVIGYNYGEADAVASVWTCETIGNNFKVATSKLPVRCLRAAIPAGIFV